MTGLDVPRETLAALESYAALLTRWNQRINLVAPSTIPSLWTRHVLDSLQIWRMIAPDTRHIADLGSGGGLPGIVLAICAKGQGAQVTLVESDARKCAFLSTAIHSLDLPATVKTARIERLQPLGAQVVTARALASLTDLLAFQQRHGAPGGIGIYPKGARADAEVETALEDWQFTCQKVPSATSAESHILKIGDLARA